MKSYTTFTEALEDFRLSGGAMNHVDGVFQVGDLEEIAEVVTGTPKGATAEALRVGGFTAEQIAAELADWVEPPPTLTTEQESEIAAFLRTNHKRPDSLALQAWYEATEAAWSPGDAAFVVEVKAADSVTGKTEVLHLPIAS